MKKTIRIIACLLATFLLVGCAGNTEKEKETEEKEEFKMIERTIDNRYFIYRIWNFDMTGQNTFEKTVDAAVDAGFNAIKVHIPWTQVERKDGEYKFEKFDKMIEYVVNTKGLNVAISLDMTRNKSDKVISKTDVMMSRSGELSIGGVNGNRTQISFASDYAMEKAVAFYKESVTHYEELYGGTGKILFYLPAFSQYCETEYWCTEEYDYSENAITKFHKYLEEKYKTIENANTTLGLNCTSFDEIEAPSVQDTSDLGIDWYNFRHNLLKNAIDKLADAQKSVAPESKFAVQFGSVFDSAIRLRGTVAFSDLCENVDVLWCDDSPTYNHPFAMSYVWSSLPENVEFAQEIDGPDQNGASQENYLKQGLECYSCGCKYLSIANWYINDKFNAYKDVWQEISSKWLTRETPETMNSYSVLYPDNEPVILTYKLKDLFKNGNSSTIEEFNSYTENGTPVIIKIEDDLISK